MSPNIETSYLGLKLKSPVIAGSSPLAETVDQAKRFEDAGVGAFVMHSLFEEQVVEEQRMLHATTEWHDDTFGEATSFFPKFEEYRLVPDRYLEHLANLKRSLGVPVIASLNGRNSGPWLDFATQLESAGADALELNVYHIAADPDETGDAVEARYLALLTELKRTVAVPVVMKLPPFFASLPNFVRRLEAGGAAGVSLFNRFFQPDINLDDLQMVDRLELSSPDEALLRIRWIAILRAQTRMTLAATGGVYGADEALKLLLAGADVVHLASALLEHGPGRLSQILHDMKGWMVEREYESLAQLKGSMCQTNLRDASMLARQSYIRVLDSFTPRPGVWR